MMHDNIFNLEASIVSTIMFYVAQAFSFLSAIAVIIGMQCKSMKTILLWQSLGNLAVAISYFLLGGISGGLICLFAVGQGVVIYFYNKRGRKPHTAVLVLFIVISIICSAITAYYSSQRSFADIFSAVGAILYTLSIAQQRPAASRLIYLFNPLCWMCYDVFTKAIVSFIVHLVVFIATGVGIVRVDILGKKKAETPTEANI